MDLPGSMFEFEERFATEQACVVYLRQRRWPAGFVCPRCGGRKAWQLRTRPLDECAGCGHQVSLTAGTAFAGTRKPLRLWFRVTAELLFSKRGCSALELTRRFPISYETAWTWLHKLRSCMDRSGGDPLGGSVEVDETYLGGVDDGEHRGRSLAGKKLLVAGAAECRGKAIGRIRLRHVLAATSAALCGFIAGKRRRGQLRPDRRVPPVLTHFQPGLRARPRRGRRPEEGIQALPPGPPRVLTARSLVARDAPRFDSSPALAALLG